MPPADAATETMAASPSAAPPPCPPAAAPVACYHRCQPAADAPAPAAPKPAACAEEIAGLGWATGDGKPPGPPTLAVEIGAANPDTGAFEPYADGQWAPIVEGIQGGVHVWAAVRLPATGATAKQMIEIAGRGYIDCNVVATALGGTGKTYALPDPHAPGTVSNASKLVPGVPIAFASPNSAAYCGQWLRLVVEARRANSAAWGRASVWLRLWAADNLSAGKK